jgi:hypothetical protein
MRKSTPQLKVLLNEAEYIDKVPSRTALYYVFKVRRYYLIFTYKDTNYRSGNFNIADIETVERIYRIFKGKKGITRREIEDHSSMKRFVVDFDVLQALYVMVALDQAFITKRSLKAKSGPLIFNFR